MSLSHQRTPFLQCLYPIATMTFFLSCSVAWLTCTHAFVMPASSHFGLPCPTRKQIGESLKSRKLRYHFASCSPGIPDNDNELGDTVQNQSIINRTTVAFVGGQVLIVVVAALTAVVIGTPNYGLGPGFDLSQNAIQLGSLLALPLFTMAAALDMIEDQLPALQDVTKATQRSVLALMGYRFRPIYALLISTMLGVAAGLGEEMLFRGIVQYEVADRLESTVTGVCLSSIVFGALHAVTPLYAVLASIASLYFGAIYAWTDNLAVPIACHTVYDIAALVYAHFVVSGLSVDKIKALSNSSSYDSNSPV